jgi:hypothetical protein
MSLVGTYNSIININRLNIILTSDAIQMLDNIVTSLNKSYIDVNTIGELEDKIKRIFPRDVADRLIKQISGVSRIFISQDLTEAKRETIYSALSLILSSLRGKGIIDGYDIAMAILNTPNLQVFKPALPQFPYMASGSLPENATIINNVTILPGFLRGTDDYVATLNNNFINASPLQLDQLGAHFGIPNASVDFSNKFKKMIIQQGLNLGRSEIGFNDLIDILSKFK